MQEYVICVALSREGAVLIEKKRPPQQAGMWNFPGGKLETFTMEDGTTKKESVASCARREFLEETGVDIDSWINVGVIMGPTYNVSIMATLDEASSRAETTTDEEIFIQDTYAFNEACDFQDTVQNVRTVFNFVNDVWRNEPDTRIVLSYAS